MFRPRVIPCLLLSDSGLVKTVRFKDPTYLGDAVNVVRIFNDKEVDELVLLDIRATPERRGPRLDVIGEIASECFMPLGYGGGIRDLADIKAVLGVGVEKIVINTRAADAPRLVREGADSVGSQSIVVSIDVKRRLWGGETTWTHGGRKATGRDPVEFAVEMARQGAGEILLNSIDRDGTMRGYDLDLIKRVSSAVDVPVVACGGAGSVQDLADGVNIGGASAVAAGSFFVFHGRHRAVLINFPTSHELETAFS